MRRTKTKKKTAKRRPAPKPKKKSTKRGAAKKKSAKRATRKRKPAPRKKSAKRAAPKRTPATKKAAKRAATKRKPAPKRAARPKLAVVRPRRPRTPPPPAFQQTAGASPKQVYLFELVRARAAVLAAIQGLTAASADRPMAEGKWSVRLTIIHLIARDRARLAEMDAALMGRRASWIGSQEDDWARRNAEEMAPLSSMSWDEAVRLLQTTRQKVTEAIESIPEDPPDVWAPGHPLMEMLAGLPPHDRHHADIMKRWREAVPTP